MQIKIILFHYDKFCSIFSIFCPVPFVFPPYSFPLAVIAYRIISRLSSTLAISRFQSVAIGHPTRSQSKACAQHKYEFF